MLWLKPKDRTVAIIGYPNHGKTVFLAGLFWDSFFALSESFASERFPYSVRAANPKAAEVFFGNAITLSKLTLPPSSPRTPPEPAILEFTGVPTPKGKRKELKITFYDIPGEAVADEEWLLENAPFLPSVTDIIFLFDPTRTDFSVRALQAADLRDKITRLVPGSDKKNFIIVLSKMDELRHQNDWAGMIAELWPDDPPRGEALAEYHREMDTLSRMLREWWLDRAQGGRGFISRLPANARFCALSSIGHLPVWDCAACGTTHGDEAQACPDCGAGRSRDTEIRLARKPAPFRVRDPLFWIFRAAGVM